MILAIKGESSGIKSALFKSEKKVTQLFNGELENVVPKKVKLSSAHPDNK